MKRYIQHLPDKKAHLTLQENMTLVLTFFISLQILLQDHFPTDSIIFRVNSIAVLIYFLFINGWLLTLIILPDYPPVFRRFIYSILLSLFIDMSLGFFVAFGLKLAGHSRPFNRSTLSTVFFGFSVVLLFLAWYSKGTHKFSKREQKTSGGNRHMDLRLLVLSLVIFLVSITGALVFRYSNSGSIIALAWVMLLLIPVWVTFHSPLGTNTFRIAIVLVSLSLTAPMLLATSILLGTDGHVEVYISKILLVDKFWNNKIYFQPEGTFAATQFYQLYNTLSDSILMPLFSIFLKRDTTFIAKEIIPALFAIIFPIALYELYRKIIGEIYGFLMTIMIMFFEFYYYNLMVGGARQPIAELFLVGLLLVLVDNSIYGAIQKFMMIIFAIGLVISHYGTTAYYIVVFMGALVVLHVLPNHANANSSRNVLDSLKTLFVILVLLFTSWNAFAYSHITGTFKVVITLAISTFKAFLLGNPVEVGVKAEVPPHMIAPRIEMATYGVIYLLSGLGVLEVFRRLQKFNQKQLLFFSIAISTFVTYGILYIIGTANAMSSWRSAHLSMISFAPLFLFGSVYLWENLINILKMSHINIRRCVNLTMIIVLALMLIFGSTVGYIPFREHPSSIRAIFFHQEAIYNDPHVAVGLYSAYPQETDIASSLWSSKYRDNEIPVYGCGYYKRGVLLSYAMVPYNYELLEKERRISSGYVYLGYVNWKLNLSCNGESSENLRKQTIWPVNLVYNSLNAGILIP